jgi:Arrestin (or S-antigen), N-terminal domain
MLVPGKTTGGRWSVSVEPEVLLPSRDARIAVSLVPDRTLKTRGVRAALIGTERYRYRKTETTPSGRGAMTTRTVEVTGTAEVGRVEVDLAGPGSLPAGKEARWEWSVHVPDLGPATFEAEVLRCEWELRVTVDRPMASDAELRVPVRVAQPTALLDAGVVDVGEYGLFDEAPVNVDAHPAQLRLQPVPICVTEPFSGAVTLETESPVSVQEVRLELRVHARVTVSGGMEEEIVVSHGRLEAQDGTFGGPLATHRFSADAPGAWLPTIDLPHGQARAAFHVILARAWARDVHYVRDVALSSTTTL